MALDLEFRAVWWLRWMKRCRVTLTQRTPRLGHGVPDVLGVCRQRYLYEIEIKRSVRDFIANDNKPHIKAFNLDPNSPSRPRYFWYLVPDAIMDKIRDKVPCWAGLIVCQAPYDTGKLWVEIPATRNHYSPKLSVRECARLMYAMSNQMYSQLCYLRDREYLDEDYTI